MKTGIYWQDPKYALKPGRDFIFDPSLVLYLPLHKLDGACFMSKDAYGHLCTVTGALWTPQGRSFDGSDDYIDCGNDASLHNFTAKTIIFWLKPTAYTGSERYLYLHGFWASPYGDYFMARPTSNVIEIGLRNTEGTYIQGGSLTYSPDTWKQAGYVWDGTDLYYIKDGTRPPAGLPLSGTMACSAHNLTIGRKGTSAYNWGGRIGEVWIHNRALTPLEIQRNYLATKWRYQ